MDLFAWILTLSILAGQLIKIPIGTHGGLTVLDIVTILLGIFGIFRKGLDLKKVPLWVKTALIFILISVLSLVITPVRLTPLEYFTSFSYIVRFCFLILLGLLIYQGTFKNIKENIPTILLISGVGLSFLGLLQIIFLPNLRFLEVYGWDPHYFRTVSTFLDPNFVGAYFVLTLLLLNQKISISKKWKVLIFIIVYLALLTTFSRSSYGMFLVSFMILSFLKRSIRLTILTLTLFLGLMLGFYLYTLSVAIPRNIDRQQSAEYRINSWERGLYIFSQSPFLGVGYNAYRYALREYSLIDQNYLKTRGASGNDSSLLHAAATTGVIGLISFLLFLSSFLFRDWRAHLLIDSRNTFLLAGLLGLIGHSFFANSLFYPSLIIWLILFAARRDPLSSNKYDKSSVILKELVKLAQPNRDINLLPIGSLVSIHQYLLLYKLFKKYVPKGSKVLDWGTGNGHFSFFLCREGYETTGFSMENFNFKAWLKNYSYKFVKGRVEEPTLLPFKNLSFDAVASVGVLEHVREFGGEEIASMQEIARILKPQGVFICYHLPNYYSLVEYLGKLLTNKFHHKYRFKRGDIEKLIQTSGFEIIALGRYGLLPRNSLGRLSNPFKFSETFAGIWDLFDNTLSFILSPICQNYFFVARKLRV